MSIWLQDINLFWYFWQWFKHFFFTSHPYRSATRDYQAHQLVANLQKSVPSEFSTPNLATTTLQ